MGVKLRYINWFNLEDRKIGIKWSWKNSWRYQVTSTVNSLGVNNRASVEVWIYLAMAYVIANVNALIFVPYVGLCLYINSHFTLWDICIISTQSLHVGKWEVVNLKLVALKCSNTLAREGQMDLSLALMLIEWHVAPLISAPVILGISHLSRMMVEI